MIQWRRVLRDVVLIFVLTGIGGALIGFGFAAAHSEEPPIAIIGMSNIALAILGFTISGCLTSQGRPRHLFLVALLLWLGSIFNVLFSAITLVGWLMGLPVILISCSIGWGLAALIVRPGNAPSTTS